jgi:hypothetical protein
MVSDSPAAWPLRHALQTARAVLDGKVGVIEGSIALARYVDAYYLSRYQVQKVGSDIQRPQ